MMKLFGHPDSGHAFKVRFFVEAAGLDYDYEEVDIWAPRESRQQEFRDHAPFHEVPLLIDDGKAYAQSDAILVHLAQKTGAWGAQDGDLFQQCLEWLFWEANKIGMCLPQLRADARFPQAALSDGARQWLLARYTHDVNLLDERFADGRTFITGDAPTIADFSLCGYLFFADEAKLAVPTQVDAWLKRLSALPGWQHPNTLMREAR
jgi:glutathione S-transferase